MKEYFEEAIVLSKEALGEADWRVFLYTETLGRIAAKVKSGRKILSKLTAHLEPLNLVKVRLIAAKDFQVVDALRIDRLKDINMLTVFNLIKDTAADYQPDQFLWKFLKDQYHTPCDPAKCAQAVLKIAGFDPSLSFCRACTTGNPDCFLLNSAEYVCSACVKQFVGSESFFRLSSAPLP